MEVGSASSTPPPVPQAVSESREVKKSGRDTDGDSDDGAAKSVQSAPQATVNLEGQAIGRVINALA